MQAQQIDSVFVKEKSSGKYVHFQPETRSSYAREGTVGACVFKPEIVQQFIAQVLRITDHYETEPSPSQARHGASGLCTIRARGYQG